MKIKDAIQQLEELAANSPEGLDGEFKLYDRGEDHAHVVDPDTDVWDFEFTWDSGAVYVEFN